MASLGDLARLRVLNACEQNELSVAELCAVLQVPQSTASRHLKVLADTAWLESRRESTSRLYRVDRESLPAPARKLWKLIREQCHADAVLRDDDARLDRVVRERQTQSQAFFSSSAGQWDRLRQELFGAQIDTLAFAALLDPDSHVGDFGCGTGRTTDLLAHFARKVVAVDTSGAMIKAARQRLSQRRNVEFHRSDLGELPLGDDSLHVVFLTLVLHHISDPVRVLREVARVLKPKGKLVIVDMQQHARADYRQQMGHVWLGFSADQVKAWFSSVRLAPMAYVPLPADPAAKGPPLFVATAKPQA